MNSKLLLFVMLLAFSGSVFAQCPTITCPSNIVVDNDSAMCGAVVNYSIPSATDTCNTQTDTINFSGAIVFWTVPAGVTNVTIEARGAQGGNSASSTVTSGLGAVMIGDFIVVPGDQLKILVGENNNSGNGGGGGTFVTDTLNNPWIIAGGGGGSSGGADSPDKHGQAGTTGGTGAAGGGTGGTAGSGGNIGASFASGAGGGLLTNGADGWTSNTGGQAYINGGAGANVGFGIGGFGGGGNGSGYVVGGGGGGYSGGGSGSNSAGSGTGGGGGSYNAGTNQSNTSGANSGNGVVYISYMAADTLTPVLIAGLGSGSMFPLGVTTETYVVDDGLGNTDTCSFTITVNDITSPTFANCPSNVSSCDSVVTGISPGAATDNCSSAPVITYELTGATVGSGSGDVSGMGFNTGLTNVYYIATDSVGNSDTCSFTVTIVDCSGINETDLINVSVYPNPAVDFTTINLGDQYYSVEYFIRDMEGRSILTRQLTDVSYFTVATDHLKSGIYTMTLVADGKTKNIKLVKQ